MTTPTAFVAAARAEIGYTENPAGSNCNKFSHALGRPCQRWCADFPVALARQTGLALPSTAAYTPTLAQSFVDVGRWRNRTAPADAGDLAFFSFGGHRIDHVEIVEVPGGGQLVDIGGNTRPDDSGDQSNGGGVFRRHRTRDRLVGFGRPYWSTVPTPAPSPTQLVEDDDMPRIVISGGAVFAVGYTTDTFVDTAGVTRSGAWRQTFKNPDHLKQHVGGGAYTVRPDGNAFDVTDPPDVFAAVYGDRGTVQP